MVLNLIVMSSMLNCELIFSEYRGEVDHGLRHGQGVFEMKSAGIVYEGAWHNGKRNGEVTYGLNILCISTGE